jgi:hypothetical protein
MQCSASIRGFLVASATCLTLTACASDPPPRPSPYTYTAPQSDCCVSKEQGREILRQLRASQAAQQALAADVARLGHDLCVMAKTSQMIEIARNPASGHNYVRAKDGALPNTAGCPP